MEDGQWRVNVREIETDKVIHTVACRSERDAERVETGLSINLNHEKFYTEVADHGEYATTP